MQGDLDKDADVKALLETTIKCYGKLDILVRKIIKLKKLYKAHSKGWGMEMSTETRSHSGSFMVTFKLFFFNPFPLRVNYGDM